MKCIKRLQAWLLLQATKRLLHNYSRAMARFLDTRNG
jgi:hypothetical protein